MRKDGENDVREIFQELLGNPNELTLNRSKSKEITEEKTINSITC